jgi:hypothetical protein
MIDKQYFDIYYRNYIGKNYEDVLRFWKKILFLMLYECVAWFLTQSGECVTRVFENSMLQGILDLIR